MVALQADEGDAPPKPKARMLLDALAGSIAGAISRVCIGPLDVIKIRFQVQLEPIAEHGASGIIAGSKPRVPSLSKYTGLKQALTTIVREEGIQVIAENCLPISEIAHGPSHAGLPVVAISRCAYLTFPRRDYGGVQYPACCSLCHTRQYSLWPSTSAKIWLLGTD